MYICEMIPTWTLTLSILAALLHGVTMLRLVDLKVPMYTIRGQPVRLECHYDLEGEALYSVKWFKDGNEFFRFQPEDDPPAQVFSQQGVFVDLPNSSDTAVMLKVVDVKGSGYYRCEVSGEAPSFKTVGQTKNMTVVDLPDASGPQIDGVRPRYHIGDTVRVNCSSSRSRPAATLSWFINQEPADETFIRQFPIEQDMEGFETSMVGLEFKVRQKHFKKGDLKLKCVAKIENLYWRTNEQSVEGDRPQKAPVLESRETFAEASSGMSVKLSSNKDTVKVVAVSLILNMIWYSCTDLTILLSWITSLGNLAFWFNGNGKGISDTDVNSSSFSHKTCLSPPPRNSASEKTTMDSATGGNNRELASPSFPKLKSLREISAAAVLHSLPHAQFGALDACRSSDSIIRS